MITDSGLVALNSWNTAVFPGWFQKENQHEIDHGMEYQCRGSQRAARCAADGAHGAGEHVVIGGYGHSRAGDYSCGGFTRTMLMDSPILLVLAY